ncbi:MAG: protein kinase [Myxococcaceae bacterium]|nr:protein kinase [Myxococcaceae bacterium]
MELIGTLVGEYRIERQLGAGAMGEVYLGVHPVIGRQVAVKVLRKEIARDDSQVKRFIEEARAVTTIKHPAVVDIFGFGTLSDSRLYLVMDLLEGESFSSYLKERAPLPASEARQWLLELLEAVAAAHDAGVVHRDLKPSNLFLVGKRGHQRLKVLDFGIARRVDRQEQLTRPNVLLGSPAFMAPEQIRGETGPSCDLYAIGCVAFVMLTGRYAFPTESLLALLNHHLLTPVPSVRSLVPAVPRALDELVQRLMAKDPADRPASAREAKQLLEGLDVADPDAPLAAPPAKTVVARVPEAAGPRTDTMMPALDARLVESGGPRTDTMMPALDARSVDSPGAARTDTLPPLGVRERVDSPRTDPLPPLGERGLESPGGSRTDTMPALAARGTDTSPALLVGAARAAASPVTQPFVAARRVVWPYVAGALLVLTVAALVVRQVRTAPSDPIAADSVLSARGAEGAVKPEPREGTPVADDSVLSARAAERAVKSAPREGTPVADDSVTPARGTADGSPVAPKPAPLEGLVPPARGPVAEAAEPASPRPPTDAESGAVATSPVRAPVPVTAAPVVRPVRPDRKAEPARPAAAPGDRLAKTPSLAELSSRLARDEAAVREGRALGGKAAALLLEDARERLSASPSAADRVELQVFLDDWERKHLAR